MAMELLLDGYNLTRRNGLTLAELCTLIQAYEEHVAITLVLDGMPKPDEKGLHSDRRIRLHYSGPNDSADNVILQMVAQSRHPGNILVVSDDRELRGRARQSGASGLGAVNYVKGLKKSARPGPRGHTGRPEPKPAQVSSTEVYVWLERFGLTASGSEKPRPAPSIRPEALPLSQITAADIAAIDMSRLLGTMEPMPDKDAPPRTRRGKKKR
jgi:hypothetical protein